MSQPHEANIKVEIVEIGEDDEDYDDVDDFENLALTDIKEKEELDIDVFICNYCYVYFISKSHLKIHLKVSHNNYLHQVYECNLCENPKTYSRIQDIRRHMRKNHNEEATDVSKFTRKANISGTNLQTNTMTNSSYLCSPCDKTYSRKQDIIKHMRSVHGKDNVNPNQYKNKACSILLDLLLLDSPKCKRRTVPIYKCEHCDDHYTEVESLALHSSTIHKINITQDQVIARSIEVFDCKSCAQSNFLSLETLKVHCQENHNYQPHIYLCPECNVHCSYGCNMVKHLREIHAQKTWTNQDLLNTIVKYGKGTSKLETHIRTSYGCNICSKTFGVQEDVESHLKYVHNADTQKYIIIENPEVPKEFKTGKNEHVTCDLCGQTFSCKQSLTNHISEHWGIDKLMCEFCNELFHNLNSIWSHIFSKHPSIPYQCSMCSLRLDRKKEVVKHMRREHGVILVVEDAEEVEMLKENCRVYMNGILRYKCQECAAVLTSFRSLQTHMFRHTGERPIICDKCSKQFRTTSALRSHISSVHENVRKFGCEYCGHAFACSSNLAQHIRIHTGEKPYVCELCGNRYAQYASLYSHKLTHAQNRCHICTECGRAFHRPSRLRQHMKIHTGDRPPRSHLCDICQKGFRTNSEMKRHQLIHNSIRSYVCETCGSGFTLRKYLIQHYKIHRDVQDELSQNVSVETITDLGYAA